MNKNGLNPTLLAAAVIVTSLLLAGLLSAATPEGSYIGDPGAASSDAVIDDPTTDEPDGEPDETPQPQPVKGGMKGGNADAVKDGRLPGYEDKEINANPDVFCYLINSDVTLDKPGGMANIMAENDPGNLSLMQLCYYLSDTDELIYVSPMLRPGEHLNGDSLSVKLKKGSYKVNAAINVYDEETQELKTTFHQDVTVTVNQKFLGIF